MYRSMAMIVLVVVGASLPVLVDGQSLAGRVSSPNTKSQSDLAQEKQAELDRAVQRLDSQLSEVGPCRFGDLDKIFGNVERLKKETVETWGLYYDELIGFEERRLDSGKQEASRLPALLAKRKTQLGQATDELATVEKRLAALGQQDDAILKEARETLIARRNSLKGEIQDLDSLFTEVAKAQEVDKTKLQIYADLKSTYESLKRRKDVMSDKYDLLLRSKRQLKEDACKPDFTPKK